MDREPDFAELYKKLIDANFAPRPERAEAALLAVLRGLAAREPGNPREAAEAPAIGTRSMRKERDR